jgi:hypothetical protein
MTVETVDIVVTLDGDLLDYYLERASYYGTSLEEIIEFDLNGHMMDEIKLKDYEEVQLGEKSFEEYVDEGDE